MKTMTEIYGTLGPACNDTDILVRMIENGMTGIRLNLSHSSLTQASDMLEHFHEACRLTKKDIRLLIDMQGPELRIGKLKSPLTLHTGDIITLSADIPVPGSVRNALRPDDTVLLDDGKLELLYKGDLRAEVVRGGVLTSGKSIKVKDVEIRGNILTEQDIENLERAEENGVSEVMLPFVRSGEDLKYLRSVLHSLSLDHIRIHAKIESVSGIRKLDEIIPESDMIVIARGDLGNDMPLWDLPAAQKEIEAKCHAAKKRYMVVTQMLTSMIDSPVPTRAEVSDIFHAVYHGASAVMVTNETAAGKYPGEAIRWLTNTVRSAERYLEEH